MSDRKTVTLTDQNGFPVLFATNGKSSASTRQHLADTPRTEIVTPDHTSGPAEWGRYHDAVREAARSFDSPKEGDVEHFLNARARNPERVDRPAFHEAVQRQRMADLVDIVDHHMRRDGSLPRGARMVRVQAPKGYMRRALRQSSPEELAHLRHRLTSVGHKSEHVDKYLGDRVNPDMWDQATNYEIHMSDSEFDGLIFDDFDVGEPDLSQSIPFFGDMVEAIKEIKPEIHIHIDRNEIVE